MLELRVKVEIDPKDLEDKLSKSDKLFREAFKDIFPLWSEIITRQIKKNVGGPSALLSRRTGALARSAEKQDYELGEKGKNFEVILTLGVPYGRIQELGTIGAGGELPDIVPRNRKFLTIPLPPALTPAGVPRNKALRAKEKGTAEYKASFIRKSKAGNLIIFMKEGSKLIPLWILKQKVAIPASKWYTISVIEASKYLPDLMAGEIDKVFEEASRPIGRSA